MNVQPLSRRCLARAANLVLATLCATALLVAALPAQTNHRPAQSPVKNQGGRGTCAAFAICAALETFPGVPNDLSEQLLYAVRKLHERDVDTVLRALGGTPLAAEGNALEDYIALFTVFGTCVESQLPYNVNPRVIVGDVDPDLRAFLERAQVPANTVRRLLFDFGKYGFDSDDAVFLDGEAILDVAALKAHLDRGVLAIPVGYRIHAPSWSQLPAVAAKEHDDAPARVIHPGMFHFFSRPDGKPVRYGVAKLQSIRDGEADFPQAVRDSKWLVGPIDADPDSYGGHAVTIVGYNEAGFIIKNSWGKNWGDGGYAVINYDYHRLYALHGLVIHKPRLRHGNLDPFAQSALLRDAQYRVKIQPLGDTWRISTFWLDRRDPDVTEVVYTLDVAGRGADGGDSESLAWKAAATTTLTRAGGSQGIPWTLDKRAATAVRDAGWLRIRATYRDGLRECVRTFAPMKVSAHQTQVAR